MDMLIGDRWVSKPEKIEVRDPYNNHIIDTVPRATVEDVQAAIAAAEKGFAVSRRLPVHQRIAILYRTAEIVKEQQEAFARTIAREGSKTIREARKEVARCINTLQISAEEARRIVGETLPFDNMPGSENRVGYYYRVPIGIIVAITPFNDPLNLVAHKLGPAIAGGNAVVLKPATATPLSALKLGQAFLNAGLPPGILNIVTGYGHEIGDALVTDERVRMITFTGGYEAGLDITRKAGLKKIAMELGSNSPVIVLKDAPLEKAVEQTVSGAFWAAGQNCLGVQRVFVESPIFDKFTRRFVERTRQLRVGDKLDERTDMGPMISEKEARRIEQWVQRAIEKGARLLTGGKRRGAIYEPTVLTDVPPGVEVDCQEVFAPVVSLYRVANLEEAIQRANQVPYGLQAGIFTRNIELAFKAIRELEVGGVMINDSSDYRVDLMPFGGVKRSGLGREGIKFALQEMTEPKVVCFQLDENWSQPFPFQPI
ncbi:MAG: aldehyde dehydrogenase family protein [Calditrichaeota bacterium]|nr:aldehyde dehydrogenase family protein [Calditrichota bacterium]